MSEEEKYAIEILKTFEFRRKTINYNKISLEDSQSVDIVINYIDKLQKVIDLMAERLAEDNKIITKKGYKEYFYKKAEE